MKESETNVQEQDAVHVEDESTSGRQKGFFESIRDAFFGDTKDETQNDEQQNCIEEEKNSGASEDGEERDEGEAQQEKEQEVVY